MTALLESAFEKIKQLPYEEQDAIAAQILDSLSDEEAWRSRFATSKDKLRSIADLAHLEDERGETQPLEQLD